MPSLRSVGIPALLALGLSGSALARPPLPAPPPHRPPGPAAAVVSGISAASLTLTLADGKTATRSLAEVRAQSGPVPVAVYRLHPGMRVHFAPPPRGRGVWNLQVPLTTWHGVLQGVANRVYTLRLSDGSLRQVSVAGDTLVSWAGPPPLRSTTTAAQPFLGAQLTAVGTSDGSTLAAWGVAVQPRQWRGTLVSSSGDRLVVRTARGLRTATVDEATRFGPPGSKPAVGSMVTVLLAPGSASAAWQVSAAPSPPAGKAPRPGHPARRPAPPGK